MSRSVLDRTGLKGDFDIDLSFDPGGPAAGAPVDDAVTVFAALSVQLGLKLASIRGPVEVLVIDSAEMSTPD